MRLLNKTTVASLLLIGSMSIGTASAMTGSHTTHLATVIGVSSVDLRVTVEDGVATLFGNVDSGAELSQAKRYVASLDGIDKVINHITVN